MIHENMDKKCVHAERLRDIYKIIDSISKYSLCTTYARQIQQMEMLRL